MLKNGGLQMQGVEETRASVRAAEVGMCVMGFDEGD